MDKLDPDTSRIPPALRRIQALWGIVALLVLFGYSVQSELFSSNDTASSAPQAAVEPVRRTAASSFTNLRSYPTQTPLELFVFLLCDGETVSTAIYDGPITNQYVALLPESDRELITDLLAGEPTILPANKRVIPSPCAERAVAAGAFP